MKQVSASLLAEDDTPDDPNCFLKLFGRWGDDCTADEIIEDIHGAKASNGEIEL